MEKSDIMVAVLVGLVALAAIVGVIRLAFAGRDALRTDNKLVNAGVTLWIAEHLVGIIFGIIVVSAALFGVILYLMHYGLK